MMRAGSIPIDKILAHDLGLDWRDRGMVAAKDVPVALAGVAGIAALDVEQSGFRIAISPTDAVLRAAGRHDLKGRSDVVVMPRAAFRAMLRAHDSANIADKAALGLARMRPGESALTGLSRGQRLTAMLLIGLMLAGLVAVPGATLFVLALLTIPVFATLLILRIAAVIDGWWASATPALPLGDQLLPIYTVLVPLYRETAVLQQLLAALLALDYPPDRLDIKILVEAHDAETQAALARRTLPGHIEVVVAPAGAPQTKPRALNIGLMEARGAFLTIYDAEDRPDPRQLRLAANLFSRHPAEVACLQGRLLIDNADDSLLTRMFALEYAALFDVINSGLIRAGAPVLLGGTSNHFRTDILRQIGGWDAWNVTEDADLSFRLVRSGYRISDLPSVTLEEAPVTLGAWFNQRVRWMKGFVQTFVTHTREPRTLLASMGWKDALVLLSLCGGTLLSALCYPLFMAMTVLGLVTDGLPSTETWQQAVLVGLWSAIFVGGLIAVLAPIVTGAMHRGLSDLLWITPFLPLYCLLVSAATFMALVDYVRAPSRWNKTEHGLARTSRLARAMAPAKVPVAEEAPRPA